MNVKVGGSYALYLIIRSSSAKDEGKKKILLEVKVQRIDYNNCLMFSHNGKVIVQIADLLMYYANLGVNVVCV